MTTIEATNEVESDAHYLYRRRYGIDYVDDGNFPDEWFYCLEQAARAYRHGGIKRHGANP